MSHNLTTANGKVEMAFVGETPWHGLGNELTAGATIEEWLVAAGMEWRILKARVRYATSREGSNDSATYRVSAKNVVQIRSDNFDELGIVSESFKTVQPRETLEFFRDLVGEAGMTLSTAGTMFGGTTFWAMATVAGLHPVADLRDTMRLNLLLATACDGSMATTGTWIATRVVCNNTLQIGLHERNAIRVKVRHNTAFDARQVKADLGIEQAQTAFERAMTEMRELATKPVSPNGVVAMAATLLHPEFATYDSDKRDKVLRSKPVTEISRLAIDGAAIGSDMAGTAGTAYGFLNAVTEYVDHSARAQTVDNRLNSAWFGKGAELKERAYTMAQTYQPSMDELIDATNASMAPRATTGSSLLDAVIDETII